MGLEFRMSGFFDTRRLSQETLSADLDPLISQLIELTRGRQRRVAGEANHSAASVTRVEISIS